MTTHDRNPNLSTLSRMSSSSSRQQLYNEILFSMLNVQKLVVKFAIVKQLHKEWKAICVKGCCEYPPPQSQVLGLAAARSDESTLGIFADSTNSNITTNSTFFGSFALDFGEKLLCSSNWGMVPFRWDLFIRILEKMSHFHCSCHTLTLPVNNIPTFFLYFLWEAERVVCRREDIFLSICMIYYSTSC